MSKRLILAALSSLLLISCGANTGSNDVNGKNNGGDTISETSNNNGQGEVTSSEGNGNEVNLSSSNNEEISSGETSEIDSSSEKTEVEQKDPLVKEPQVGVEYYFVADQKQLGHVIYWSGVPKNSKLPWYPGSVNAPSSSVKVKLESAEGGYYLTFELNGSKKYLNAIKNDGHDSLSIDSEAKNVWTYDSTNNTLVADIEGNKFFCGSNSSYDTFSCRKFSGISSDYPAHFYDVEITDYNFDHPNSGESSSSGTGESTTYEPFTDTVDTGDLVEHYASCKGKTGMALFDALKTVSKKGYHSLGYGGLWNAYKVTDLKSDGYINDYYSCISKYKPDDHASNYSKEGDMYNREHSIPKSWWGGSTENQGCDIYIIYPTDGKINSVRSNYPFGEVSSFTTAAANNYCGLGNSNFPGFSGKVFEPNDQWKGDFARTYFYACVAWDSTTFTTEDGSKVFTSSITSPNFGLTTYARNLFVKWAHEDPVDDWERHRNDGGQKTQGNRNPFIDHPEYIDAIWGN